MINSKTPDFYQIDVISLFSLYMKKKKKIRLHCIIRAVHILYVVFAEYLLISIILV